MPLLSMRAAAGKFDRREIGALIVLDNLVGQQVVGSPSVTMMPGLPHGRQAAVRGNAGRPDECNSACRRPAGATVRGCKCLRAATEECEFGQCIVIETAPGPAGIGDHQGQRQVLKPVRGPLTIPSLPNPHAHHPWTRHGRGDRRNLIYNRSMTSHEQQ